MASTEVTGIYAYCAHCIMRWQHDTQGLMKEAMFEVLACIVLRWHLGPWNEEVWGAGLAPVVGFVGAHPGARVPAA